MSMYGGMPVKAPVKHWMIDLRSKKDHCDSCSPNSNICKVLAHQAKNHPRNVTYNDNSCSDSNVIESLYGNSLW